MQPKQKEQRQEEKLGSASGREENGAQNDQYGDRLVNSYYY